MPENMETIFEDFHGKEYNPRKDEDIDLGDMSEVAFLGECFAVEYKAKKEHLGDKRKTLYRHEFKPKQGCRVFWNGKVLIIAGDIKVTARGII